MTTITITPNMVAAVPQLAIVGQCYEDHLVYHAAILAEDANVSAGQEVRVYELGINGLVVGPTTIEAVSGPPTLVPDVVGYIDLQKSERNQIATHLAQLDEEAAAEGFGFILLPHADYEQRRFSCIGLIHDCYATANIELVDLATLPVADLEKVLKLFPSFEKAKNREAQGLTEDNDWTILFPGYSFHSLARDDGEIRATPYPVDSVSRAHYPSLSDD